MGLLNNLDRLEKLKPYAVTVWATTQNGYRYQANICLRAGGGWHVQFGHSIEEAMEKCAEGALRGERVFQGATQADVARNLIRAAADPDDDDRTPQRRPVKRAIVPPPKQARMRF